MRELALYLVQTAAGSALLLGTYLLLLEKRAEFLPCRLYLLFSAIAAAVIPLLHIPVWQTVVRPQLPQSQSESRKSNS